MTESFGDQMTRITAAQGNNAQREEGNEDRRPFLALQRSTTLPQLPTIAKALWVHKLLQHSIVGFLSFV